MSPKLLQTYPHIVDRRRIFDIIKKPSAINLKFTYLPLSKSKCHFFSGAINCCLGNQIQNDTFFPPINCCLSNFQCKQIIFVRKSNLKRILIDQGGLFRDINLKNSPFLLYVELSFTLFQMFSFSFRLLEKMGIDNQRNNDIGLVPAIFSPTSVSRNRESRQFFDETSRDYIGPSDQELVMMSTRELNKFV